MGTDDDEELGIGAHLIEAQLRDRWRQSISGATEIEQFQMQVPMMLRRDRGNAESLKKMLPGVARPWLDGLEPAHVPQAHASQIEFLQGDLPPASVQVLDLRLGTEADRRGVLRLYGSALPARLLALVGRGDERMFERMARVFAPGERSAAILFADVEASGELGRRLASAAFFGLIRDLTTEIDAAVVEHLGLVGKHAGDGVTAFFLEEDLGSASAAAVAAIATATAITDIAASLSRRHARALQGTPCQVNIGLHWGDSLFIGQVVTGGRIEVTALGDEVNRGARLEQTASNGQILASRPLLERLDPEAAEELGLGPRELDYRPLGELDTAHEKARRDAGDLSVARIGGPTR